LWLSFFSSGKGRKTASAKMVSINKITTKFEIEIWNQPDCRYVAGWFMKLDIHPVIKASNLSIGSYLQIVIGRV
jgi:hypothetical protein